MREVLNTRTGQKEMVYDHIYVDGKEMYYVRAFTIGILDDEEKYVQMREIFETPEHDFVYRNGRIIEDRAVLEQMPDEKHRIRALAWFDKRSAKEEKKKAGRPKKEVIDDNKTMPEM